MAGNPIVLRLFVTITLFVTLSTVVLFLPIAHLIGDLGIFLLVWLCSWSFSRYFVEYKFLNEDVSSIENKAVLITGCDSGFGKGVAIKLSNLGYHVIACCFDKESGYKDLLEHSKSSKGKIDLALLDVTSESSVNDLYEFVKQSLSENEKLWSVVNNAGLGGYHGFNWGANPVSFYEKIFAVNTIGLVRMTEKFTPLLLECPSSRFVFLSSYAGRLSFSGMVAYDMSKHSVRVFGNCIRRELEHLNVKSIIIEPTMYKTEMTNCESSLKMFDSSWNQTDKKMQEKIGLKFYNKMREGLISLMGTTRDEVDEVIDTIVKSVRLNNPYPFYRVSNVFQRLVLYFTEYLPEETHDVFLTGQFNTMVMKMFKLSNQY